MTGAAAPVIYWRNDLAKILISRDGVLEQTVQLTKERMTIGRHGHNDIVLEHRGRIVGWSFLQALERPAPSFGIGLNRDYCGKGHGKALMGHKAGDEVTVEAPRGVIRYRVDKIER